MFILGDLIYYFFLIISFGQSKKISSYIAKKWLKMEDCGCNNRRNYLNNLFVPNKFKRYIL